MRYKLRTLLILLAVGPMVICFAYRNWGLFQYIGRECWINGALPIGGLAVLALWLLVTLALTPRMKYRYTLRTLLILMAVVPPLLATAWLRYQNYQMLQARRPKLNLNHRVPINGGRQWIVFKVSGYSPISWHFSERRDSVKVIFGNQEIHADATHVKQLGGRNASLPASWNTAEVTLYSNDFRVLVDGLPLK
jgi:hypothetical protein